MLVWWCIIWTFQCFPTVEPTMLQLLVDAMVAFGNSNHNRK
jgi:hypothetical protein